ncbi:MAG: HAMP domain-containing protein [Calditrichaeota bacterium]|nr:HAMP domain-containing protein [Calditrichota bacterium]
MEQQAQTKKSKNFSPVNNVPPWRSIKLRAALFSWLLVIITITIYVTTLFPYIRRSATDRMKSEARSIAVSMGNVTANAILLEDYSFAVDHCLEVIKESKSILYIVVTRKDGFSLIHTKKGWESSTLKGLWTPAGNTVSTVQFLQSKLVGRKVFHYTYPLQYSGIDWGWIHVGLSLDDFNTAMHAMLIRSVLLAVLSIVIGLAFSIIFAGKLSQPIRELDAVTQLVASGDLSARAKITTKDELGSLAKSFNEMTKTLQDTQSQLMKAHNELERKVEERTAELRQTNAHLQQEIQERKQVEKNLQVYMKKLKKSNQELQDFAYIASHDLQEPLRKVQAFSDRLKTKYHDVLGDQGSDYLDRMQNAAGRMQSFITDLLSYSRVTTKAKPFTETDLSKIVSEVLDDLQIRIEDVSGRVEVDPLPTIEADPLQMRQLFQNLIGNALKYHKKDVAPLIKVYQDNPRQKNSGSNAALHNGFCHITVEDNGIGFEEKYTEQIFNVFQRLHGRSEYKGSGVGLAICRKIIDRHNGEITAKGKPGEGAKFMITLPTKQKQGEHTT